jgi:3-hydroxyisobutyrate dehydrogenase-like beta-hydroxyacid dehydrogenase
MNAKAKIGFIGLGKMGNPMANRLIDAGYSLTVYDLLKETTMGLAAKGAMVADSPKAVAAPSDVIITMIPDDVALESVVMGANGILEGVKSGKTLIDTSTVSPDASSRVAEAAKKKGVNFLRSTVSGSPKFAEAGTLTLFISGPEEVYKKCSDIFGLLGQKLNYVGTGEEARYVKLLINMIVGTTAMIVSEALTFGEKGGVDWNKMLDAIGTSVVASPVVGYKLQPLKDRDLKPTFTVSQMSKDFDLALMAGRSRGVPLPITSLVRQFMRMMQATGRGEWDLWALVTLMEELAGVRK